MIHLRILLMIFDDYLMIRFFSFVCLYQLRIQFFKDLLGIHVVVKYLMTLYWYVNCSK